MHGTGYTYAELLALSDRLREPLFRSIIDWLSPAPGSRGLDAGCGIGSHTALLAEKTGTHGSVTGCDRSSALLAIARAGTHPPQVAQAISFQQEDLASLSFADASFDWIWSADCIGYDTGSMTGQLAEAVRVLKPGGWIALLLWSCQLLLPGYPVLEAHLNATTAGIAPFLPSHNPESHFLRLCGRLREAGLLEATARTFTGDISAPLGEERRAAVGALFAMRWGESRDELEPGDRSEFERLCDPESTGFIADDPAYYGFFTYTLFRAYRLV